MKQQAFFGMSAALHISEEFCGILSKLILTVGKKKYK